MRRGNGLWRRALPRMAVAMVAFTVIVGAAVFGAPPVATRIMERPDASSLRIREERRVVVDGVEERWRLVWDSPPLPACDSDDVGSYTCPCVGFAYGERGDLKLVRLRQNHQGEELRLSQFFSAQFPAGGVAVIPRWPIHYADMNTQEADQEGFSRKVRARPPVQIMRLRDYNRDGRETEFFLQVEVAPCGKRLGIVVGLSRERPNLHAFGTALHPDTPLVLRIDHWEALAGAKGTIRRVDWPCGDHASPNQEELDLRADLKGIHVTRYFYNCTAGFKRGSLLRTEQH